MIEQSSQLEEITPQSSPLITKNGQLNTKSTDLSQEDGQEDKAAIIDRRVDELYDKVGGCGLFQIFAYFAIAWGISSTGWFTYAIGFLIQEPETYICTLTDGSVIDTCTRDQVCHSQDVVFWEQDPNSKNYLDNWQQRLNLTCVVEWKIGLIGASIYIGTCITILWLPQLADKYGRKNFFWFGQIIDLALYTGLLFTENLAVMIAIMVLFGIFSSLRVQVGYVYLMEMMPKKW